ncbi:phage tail tape measure protein [Cryobacterium sp. PH31-O1]|uniref:phage tail tape measure protein n=1 Tax=Cryobacterium sp. PH31-O1 TaxID=3046306 RepID=UPI0024BADD41|nr:phage tail tape measure protein [Cryobacterium sp. PH31-O1]MDJ0337473.1 phage tail tape measure protein [Cryobacterium sp. PH31-O1]
MSAFNAGAIQFLIQAVGAEVFKRDLNEADKAVAALGASSETAAKKVAPVGEQVDKTGKAAQAAKAPLDGVSTATKKMGDENATAAPKVKLTAKEIDELKKKSDDAGRLIGTAAIGIGVAIAAMATIAIGTYAKFDEASSKTAAATMATREQQDLLKKSAIEQGAASIYSAKEAADAQTELAKAGVSVNDILAGGLKGSLALAAAGELEVARAAEIAATTLTVFGLKGDQAGHVADLLAAGAGKAQGSVEDLSLGLGYVGVSFARLNIPLEDTVGTLALLAANGLLGEKAGTGLRSVISSLTAPVAKGSEVMKQYNIDVFDAQGNFIGMQGAAQELQDGLGGLDEQTRSAALGAIFGAEAASAAGILYKSGAKGVKEWTDNVDDQGFAAEQAAMKTDNLMGDIELLGGSIDSILIKTGGQANGVLRDMVQILIGLTDWYGSLDDGAQGAALAIGIGTAAVLLLGGTFLIAVPKIVAFRAALTTLNTTMKGTAVAGGAIGLAVTAAAIVLGIFASRQAEAKAKVDSFTDSLEASTGAFTDNTRQQVINSIKGTDAAKIAKLMGISLGDLTNAALGNADAIESVNGKLTEYRKKQDEAGGPFTSSMAEKTFTDIENLISNTSESLADSKVAWQENRDAMGESTDVADEAVPVYEDVKESVDGVITSISDLITELDDVNGKHLDSREAARQLEQSYRDFDAALEENGAHLNAAGTDLDITTEKGSALQGALDAIADSAMESGQSILDSKGSYEEYRTSLETSRESLLTRIGDLGITGQAAEDLATEILKIPTKTEWDMQVNTDVANAKIAATKLALDTFLTKYNAAPASARLGPGISSGGMWQKDLYQADGGKVDFYAGGGRSENHVAQFARAGTMRVWAEPETGGEWYIPASPAKRPRSMQILASAANEFGYQLVPSGSPAFADGGRTAAGRAPGASAAGPKVEINVTTPPNEDPRILAKQIAREFTREMAG